MMKLCRIVLAALALSLVADVAAFAQPYLDAGSKIRGDYYRGNPLSNNSPSRRGTTSTAPQIVRNAPPSNATADNSPNRTSRTFSVQPNGSAPVNRAPTYSAPRFRLFRFR